MEQKTSWKTKSILFTFFIVFTLCIGYITSRHDGNLHIIFCDVGQGDGAYIKLPDGQDMLIDGGPGGKILNCLGEHMPFWDRTISVMFLTHPQKDHFGGLTEVLKRFKVQNIELPIVTNPIPEYEAFLHEVVKEKAQISTLSKGNTINFSRDTKNSVVLNVMWPDKSNLARLSNQNTVLTATSSAYILGISDIARDPNEFSQVVELSYKGFNTVFTGDLEADLLKKALASREKQFALEVLKVPHHGATLALNEEILQIIKPALAVISVGKNSYGHPTDVTLNLLERTGAKILRTDKEGSIETISDGEKWWVVQ
jgi:beta-lactamase superfamily II metal-dependent hydrolase